MDSRFWITLRKWVHKVDKPRLHVLSQTVDNSEESDLKCQQKFTMINRYLTI